MIQCISASGNIKCVIITNKQQKLYKQLQIIIEKIKDLINGRLYNVHGLKKLMLKRC